MSADALTHRYARALAAAGFQSDPTQQRAIAALERVRDDLLAVADTHRPPIWRRLARRLRPRHRAVRGLYLWGGVGRGKTWLMDLFYESLPFEDKARRHFHRFMRGVHDSLARHRNESDPLQAVARDLSSKVRVLCLDELFVSDIADAMLLGGLFTHLVEQGVTLVFTSNVPPDGLYRDGLQRQRFLPAIALLERSCEVHAVDGATDYRLRQLTRRPTYHLSARAETATDLPAIFADLADGAAGTTEALDIEGRRLPVVRRHDTVVWFEFDALCEGPRSQDDYVQIAREFSTVIVANVPLFDATREDAARRFIALVDEFYDRRVNLVVSAAADPLELYRGERLRFEFERTASRLIEMQSESYLASEHRA